MTSHDHHRPHAAPCACGHEHRRERPRGDALGHGSRATAVWTTVWPILACAVCPACLSTYAKVFASLGVGAALSARAHLAVLAVAIAASLLVSGVRSWRAKRPWPLVVALSGCALVLAGHLGDAHALEWLGVVVLVVGGLLEQRLARAADSSSPSGASTRCAVDGAE